MWLFFRDVIGRLCSEKVVLPLGVIGMLYSVIVVVPLGVLRVRLFVLVSLAMLRDCGHSSWCHW